MASKKSTDALQRIYKEFYKGNVERLEGLAAERENAAIARQIYTLRTRAGLTQRELANRVGTTTSVISRLENADYDGHSLSMLRRIATAFDRSIEVRFTLRRSAVR